MPCRDDGAALGEGGFKEFQRERGQSDVYRLTSVQTDAILRMTLGQLAGLEQEKLAQEHAELLAEIEGYLTILSDQRNIYAIIKEDLIEIARRLEMTGGRRLAAKSSATSTWRI